MPNNNKPLATILSGDIVYTGDTLFTEDCDLTICKGDYLNTILANIQEQFCTAILSCKLKTSETDECCDYLQAKFTSTDLSITFTKNTVEVDGKSCETLNAKVNFPVETLTWVDIIPSAPFAVADRFQYSKDNLGNVRIRGIISGPTVGLTFYIVATLPLGFRPSNTAGELFIVPVTSGNLTLAPSPGMVSILPSGQIFLTPGVATGTWTISMNCEFNVN